MGVAAILAAVRAAGVTLRAEGDGIRAEPASRLPAPLREAIKANRSAILEAIRERDRPATRSASSAPAGDTADLLALVERVARAYRTPPDEVPTMKRLALADPDAAWSAFMATARTDGIH